MNGRTLNDWFTRTVSRLGQTIGPPAPGRAIALAEVIAGVPPAPVPAQSAPQTILILDRERRVVDAGRGVERVLGRSRPDLIGRRVDHVPSLGGRGELESLWPDGTVHRLEFCATVAPRGERSWSPCAT
jgi:PAS domain-containing protein